MNKQTQFTPEERKEILDFYRENPHELKKLGKKQLIKIILLIRGA